MLLIFHFSINMVSFSYFKILVVSTTKYGTNEHIYFLLQLILIFRMQAQLNIQSE